jgi:hypothetical protein
MDYTGLTNLYTKKKLIQLEAVQEHKDTDQVSKDIARSMWKFTKGKPNERLGV